MAKPLPALDYLAHSAKHPIQPICVVFGEEIHLKRLVLRHLRSELLGEGDSDFSLSVLNGDEAEPREVFDELATVALFGSSQRVVLIEAADGFVSKYRSQLEAYVSRTKFFGVLILELKTWASNTRLFKALAETGLQIDCKSPSETSLLKWLNQTAKHTYQSSIEGPAAEQLLEIIGPEMGLLDQELAKLALIAGPESPITLAMIEELVGGWRAKTAWDMLDAAAIGNAQSALEQLDRLLLAGENPIALLAQIGATLRKFAAATRMIQEAELHGQKISLRQALETAGFKSWPAAMQKAERQIMQLGRQRAGQLYSWLLDADLALKGSSSAPARARLVLEQLIVRMAAQLNPGRPVAKHRS